MKKNWKLKSSNLFLSKIVLFVSLLLIFGFKDGSVYYFPIHPGQTNYLAGTMGELRGSHFHGGIDIKTGGVTGLDVYSTADGYVSRIKVSGGGYGNALYIYHPKYGTTSVYGHLEKYRSDIAAYVRKAQYQNKTFSIELFPDKDMFQVKRGELVAYSGNSGSSSGPHVHFEIRDGYQRPMNPLDYGFSEINDNVPPTVRYLALRTLEPDARIDNQFGTFEYTPYKSGSSYILSTPIEVHGTLGLMIDCFDQLNGVPNRNGVPHIKMYVDDTLHTEILIDKVPFSKNRDILIYRDNDLKNKTGKNYQKMYIEDGNDLNIYEKAENKGKITINDTLDHEVRFELRDAYNNLTLVKFTLRGVKPSPLYRGVPSDFSPDRFDIQENILKFMARRDESNSYFAEVYANRMRYEINSAYHVDGYAVYLWDLRDGLPDSIHVCGDSISPKLEMLVPSESEFTYYQPRMEIQFYKNTLFDTLYLHTDYIDELESDMEYFEIGDPELPMRKSMRVTLKTQKPYPNKSKTRVYSTYNHRTYNYAGGSWSGKDIVFNTRYMGTFTLLEDNTPPTIKMAANNRNSIMAYITDDLSGIKSYSLTVNGKWVLMNYDPKRNLIWSEKMDDNKPFVGDVVLEVRDNVNNIKTFKTKIN